MRRAKPIRLLPKSLRGRWRKANCGLPYATVWGRVVRHGWSIKLALSAPLRYHTVLGSRIKKANYVLSAKSKPCADCSGMFPEFAFTAMEFDHVPERGTKKFMIGQAHLSKVSFASLESEIKKCDLVCANCHKIRTARRHAERRKR
jgi:hypothetical protein